MLCDSVGPSSCAMDGFTTGYIQFESLTRKFLSGRESHFGSLLKNAKPVLSESRKITPFYLELGLPDGYEVVYLHQYALLCN